MPRPTRHRPADADAGAPRRRARHAALGARRALGLPLDRRREPAARSCARSAWWAPTTGSATATSARSASSARCGWTTRRRSPRCATPPASCRASSRPSTRSRAARLLRGARRRAGRRREGDQEGLPRSPASCTPTSTPRPGGRGEVQGGGRRPTRSSPTPSGARPTTRFGHEGLRSGGWAPRSAGFGSVEDIFQAFFGSGDPFGFGGRGPATGGDIAATVEVTLRRSPKGTQRELQFDAVMQLRALPRQRRRAGHADPHLRPLRRPRPGAAGFQTPFGQLVRASSASPATATARSPRRPCVRIAAARAARPGSAASRSTSRPGSRTASGSGSRRRRPRRRARWPAGGPVCRGAGGRGRALPPRRRGSGLDRRRAGDRGNAWHHGERRDAGG